MTAATLNPAELVSALGFFVVDPNSAIGELRGMPAMVSVIEAAPLQLLVSYRIDPEAGDLGPVRALFAEIPASTATFEADDKRAWLRICDCEGLDVAAAQGFLDQVGRTLVESGVAAPAGCLRCGTADNAHLMFLEGHPTRICPPCLEQARQEQTEAEQRLNRASWGAALGLPALGAIVVGGWALAWTAVDLLLAWFQVRVIEINSLTCLLFGAVLLAFGWGLGSPLGRGLRQAGFTRWQPLVLCGVVVLAAGTAGEILYMALFVFRAFGVFDLAGAARFAGQAVLSYPPHWIVAKLLCLASLGFFCAASASERRIVALDV